jgi:D-3-phosphoglycerate dehydrogenase
VNRARIAATGPVDPIAAEILAPFGEIVTAANTSMQSLLPLLKGAVALIVRGDGLANASIIEAATDLKVIGRTGVGHDNVDIAAATRRGIPVVFTPGASDRAVAEGALALMLALCKNLSYWDRQLKQGNWQSRHQSRPRDLDGATLGIIGFGRIGQMLAALVRPFNMTTVAYDPYVSAGKAEALGARRVDLDVLLRNSDFISLHAALTDETRGLINRERLALVKPGAYLINLARGGIVASLDVLYQALQEGRLAGVGLDVFDPEPPDVSHPIFKLPNCLASPHALAMSEGAMKRIFSSMAEDMAAVLRGERPRFVVNPEVLG